MDIQEQVLNGKGLKTNLWKWNMDKGRQKINAIWKSEN
jgi:hypothetical protein